MRRATAKQVRVFSMRRVKGFTLIELMIAVAIVGILAAIAYPSYLDQIRKSRRAEVQGALMSASNALERYFTVNNSYAGAALGAGGVFPNQAPLDGATKFYNLSILPNEPLTAADTSYRLRATPIAGTGQAGDGMLELSSTGAKSWDRDNSGAFGAGENSWNH